MPSSQTILIVVGTRPEAIKMAPVYYALKQAGIDTRWCATMQHAALASDVFTLFSIQPDFCLDVMQQGQDLFHITTTVLERIKPILQQTRPALVLVHGDTTTTFAAGLAAFYEHIPVMHVEAGLRTDTVFEPFPEEANRRMVDTISTYHCVPTQREAEQLKAYGISHNSIVCTGNTIVDAVCMILERIDAGEYPIDPTIRQTVSHARAHGKKIMLLTTHRREALAARTMEQLLYTAQRFVQEHPQVQCIYPYHPNPAIMQIITQIGMHKEPNVLLCAPLSYAELLYVLRNAHVVLTDSGGIQEEAVTLGVQVLIARERTERMQAVNAGYAHLVGFDHERITTLLALALEKERSVDSLVTLFGDGYASARIAHLVKLSINHNRAEAALDAYYREALTIVPRTWQGSTWSVFVS